MKISEIFEEWDKDSKIDVANLQFESLKIPELHNKYYKIFISERLVFRKQKETFASLKHEKREFYTLGPDESTKEKGWELPPRGKILKNEVDTYLAVDKELVELSLKIGQQEEKIELVRSILDTLKNRSFQISNAVKFMEFVNGK